MRAYAAETDGIVPGELIQKVVPHRRVEGKVFELNEAEPAEIGGNRAICGHLRLGVFLYSRRILHICNEFIGSQRHLVEGLGICALPVAARKVGDFHIFSTFVLVDVGVVKLIGYGIVRYR